MTLSRNGEKRRCRTGPNHETGQQIREKQQQESQQLKPDSQHARTKIPARKTKSCKQEPDGSTNEILMWTQQTKRQAAMHTHLTERKN
jgi:hypothetical protein